MRTSASLLAHYRLLVVGGGSAGMGASHKFARILPPGSVAVIEPSETHYYQPGFTLVGGGLMTLKQNQRSQADLIPARAKWIGEGARTLRPQHNAVVLDSGEEVTYDFLIIATGIQPRYDLIKGLPEAMATPSVCSIYLPEYAEKTLKAINSFKSGNALFTFPNGPIKCAGAPQKIMYLAEDIFRRNGCRKEADMHYFTTLPMIFAVEKYAKALHKVAASKNISVHTRYALTEVDGDKKLATFDVLNAEGCVTGKTVQMEYSLLHVVPPCLPVAVVRECSALVDSAGFVDVDHETLQSTRFPNVFAIGDTTNTLNAKTAAAVSSQLKTVGVNLKAAMDGRPLTAKYDGYTSCPLVLGDSFGMLAEFTPKGPLETFPFNQAVPRRLFFLMKRYLMPTLYWHGLVKGIWNGPAKLRKIFHLGMGK